MKHEPVVAIVLVNWNRVADTLECAESILQSNYKNVRIIICENGSEDDSWKHMLSWAKGTYGEIEPSTSNDYLRSLSLPNSVKPVDFTEVSSENVQTVTTLSKVNFIKIMPNRGFAGGNNVGLKLALNDSSVQYFWILNNDTVIEKDAISKYLKSFSLDADIGISGCNLVYYGAPNMFQAMCGSKFNYLTGTSRCLGQGQATTCQISKEEVIENTDFVTGASMFVTRKFLETVGFLEENFKIYFEEIDWRLRAGDTFKVGYAEDVFVYHKEGLTMSGSVDVGSARSPAAEFFLAQSRIKFAKKHFPLRVPIYWLYLALTCLKHVLRRRFSNVKPLLCAMFGIQLYR